MSFDLVGDFSQDRIMSDDLDLKLFRASKETQYPALVDLAVLDPNAAENLIFHWFNTYQQNSKLHRMLRDSRLEVISLNQTVEEKERSIKKEGVAGLVIGAMLGAATVAALVLVFGG